MTAPKQLTSEEERRLSWAWSWARPCTWQDVHHQDAWLASGCEGGLRQFLEHAEGIWMAHMLSAVYPDWSKVDIDTALETFLSRSPGSVKKDRTLRSGKGQARRLEKEVRWRERIRNGYDENLELLPEHPWSEAERVEMALPGQGEPIHC